MRYLSKMAIYYKCQGIEDELIILLGMVVDILEDMKQKCTVSNSKQPSKYLIPFEIKDVDSREIEDNNVTFDILPVETISETQWTFSCI